MLLQGGRRRSAKQQAKATTTKKNMHKPIAFDVCSHNVSYTQCEQASQPRKWARYVHVLRIRHALKWLWQIIFLVNAFNMVINQALTNTHTGRNTRRTTDTHSCRVKASKSFSYWIRQFKWIRRQCHRHDHRHYHRHRQRQRQSNNCCGFAPAQTA